MVELLAQITGATDVRFLMRDDTQGWCLEGGLQGHQALTRCSVREARARGVFPQDLLKHCLNNMEPLVIDDVALDGRYIADPYFSRSPEISLLALPVLVQGRASAFVLLENRLCRAAFNRHRVDTVKSLCSLLATSLENVRLYQSLERKVQERTRELEALNKQLEELTTTDALTGISNRRCFDHSLASEWQRASRAERPLALIMIDVDWFKPYNDMYGHPAGDACLQMLARVLKLHGGRAADLVARYGGEEFALIAPELSPTEILALAESIRVNVEALQIPHAASPFDRATVSIGVASLIPSHDTGPEALLNLADQRLYIAKDKGRNQSVGAT